MAETEFKVGQIVRDRSSGTLFEVLELPKPRNPKDPDKEPGDPRLAVSYRDNPSQVRRVDPKGYEAVSKAEIAEHDRKREEKNAPPKPADNEKRGSEAKS